MAEAWMVQAAGREIRISNPDKVYFPQRGYTKRDVVSYYLAVGDGILRALRDRPTTLQRFPEGIEGEAFYQKRAPAKGMPTWVNTARIAFPSGRTADEVCPTDLAHVAWAAQLGTIVFHPWPVRAADTDSPDELRLDLDPQPSVDFSGVATVAGTVREVLADLGWTGYPKTSGGRGMHVYVRIRPQWSFVQVRRAAIAIGREVERRLPALATTAWWKEERGDRVFLDYNQMARDRTIACAYSLRANARATVSMPVRWEELPDIEPNDFDLLTAPKRIAEAGDAHEALDEVAHDLLPALEWAARDEREGLGDMPYPPDHPKMPGEPLRVQPSRAKRTE